MYTSRAYGYDPLYILPSIDSFASADFLIGSYGSFSMNSFDPLLNLSPFVSFFTNIGQSYYPLITPSYQPEAVMINGLFNFPQSFFFKLPFSFDYYPPAQNALFSPLSSSIFFPSHVNSSSAGLGIYLFPSILAPLSPFSAGLQFPPLSPAIAGLTTQRRSDIILPPLKTVPVYTYFVVNIYPHDLTAFTEGLLYENGFLYEGTGIWGSSSLRKVDLETGTVLQSLYLAPQYFGEGITIAGNRIIQLTWLNNIGFVYDKYTFALLQEFYYPTEGWGLTYNGKNLIMSDGTSVLHFLDPVTFAEVGLINVYDASGPVPYLNELEFIHGEIYANVWLTDKIARINPVTGQVVGWIDLTGLLDTVALAYQADVLNGIAYDPVYDRLFVTGKFWPFLFEIELVPLL